MASPGGSIQWTWDDQHQDYYYVTLQNGQYIYYWAKEQSAPTQSRQSRVDSGTHETHVAALGQQISGSTSYSTGSPSYPTTSSTWPAASASYPTSYPAGYTSYSTSSSHGYTSAGAQASPDMPDPVDPNTRMTQPNFIEGTPDQGWYESLDSSYRMRTGAEAREFFRVGRVFAMLYSEAASERLARQKGDNDAVTVVRFGQSVYSQIRRFIVVSVKHGFVYACGISTYSGRATFKPGCIPAEHTIVYFPPTDPGTCYLPGEVEAGLTKEPIEIYPADSTLVMLPTSRLRFGRTYSVECNVKVKDIGRVNPQHISNLVAYWRQHPVY